MKLDQAMRKQRVMQVYDSLKEKGYNPVGQIVGYILTEDPTYITNHSGARQMISRIDREELLKDLITDYLKKIIFPKERGNSLLFHFPSI